MKIFRLYFYEKSKRYEEKTGRIDQLLEGRPEKICIFYICVCVFICIMNTSSVYIEKEEKQPPSSGSWSAAHS